MPLKSCSAILTTEPLNEGRSDTQTSETFCNSTKISPYCISGKYFLIVWIAALKTNVFKAVLRKILRGLFSENNTPNLFRADNADVLHRLNIFDVIFVKAVFQNGEINLF